MFTKEEIVQTLESNKKKIRSFGVKSITLFGSYAQGKARQESDLDFLVEFDSRRGRYDDYRSLKLFLEELFKIKVDLVKPTLVRKELRSSILEGEQIVAQI